MKTNSKSIGNNWERDFCKLMNEWFTGDKESDVVWRDNSSGARGTTRQKRGKVSYKNGDIVANHRDYEYWFELFFVDTKTTKEANLMFINPKNQKSNFILKEWDKVNSECPDGMLPIMPVKVRDRKTPEFILLPWNLIFNFRGRMSVEATVYPFHIMLLNEFFELNDKKKLYDMNYTGITD